jgi:hypothetical protein
VTLPADGGERPGRRHRGGALVRGRRAVEQVGLVGAGLTLQDVATTGNTVVSLENGSDGTVRR